VYVVSNVQKDAVKNTYFFTFLMSTDTFPDVFFDMQKILACCSACTWRPRAIDGI